MTSWLISLLWPVTILLAIILLFRQPLKKYIDANTRYYLWGLLPLSLLVYSIELPWQSITSIDNNQLLTLVINPSKAIEQQLSSHYLLWVWLMGTSMLIAYWLISDRRYRQALKAKQISTTLSNNHLKQLPPQLILASSSHIHSPMLMGLFKQTLVIPEDFDELYNHEQQQLIIAHEVCHFSHHHMWTNQFALLLLALFWFHPLAWRAYAVFRQDQEHACDQIVLARKTTKSRIEYCKALVLAAETSPPNAFTLMSFKQNGEQNFMFNRINQIKNITTTKTITLTSLFLVSTTLLAGLSYAGSYAGGDEQASYQDEKSSEPTYRIEPKYPLKAAKEGVEGGVLLKFDITIDGSVENVAVINAKPAYVFDQTAITALKQWRYKPSSTVQKGMLVQLDYRMGNSSYQSEPLFEKIEVKK